MIRPISPVRVLEALQARRERALRFKYGTFVPEPQVEVAPRAFACVELSVAGMTIGQALAGVR